MSSAIIRTGGKQFRVEPGSTVRVPLLKQEVGASVDLEHDAVRVGEERAAERGEGRREEGFRIALP